VGTVPIQLGGFVGVGCREWEPYMLILKLCS
jgi:hypothetical protein